MSSSLRIAALGIIAWTLAIAGTPALAESLPTKGQLDTRIRTAFYSPNQVYRLYGYVGYAIELIFSKGEVFEGDAGGDLKALTFGWHTNHVVLKPKAASVGTNLIIYTNDHAYRFEYSASSSAPDRATDPVMFAVRFIYPVPAGALHTGPSVAQQINADFALAQKNRPRNYDYWYCGSPSLKPIAASDDGVETRLTFGARSPLPALFLQNADGSESLLNFNVEHGVVVIQRVARRFILRRGKLTGCIVNEAYTGGGERLKTGTISPQVEREVREPTE